MRRTALALVLSSALLVACSGGRGPSGGPGVGDGAASTEPGPARTYPIGSRTEVFVDSSRPTSEHGSSPATPDRTLRTTVLFPAISDGGPPDTSAGPYPLIVFAHGSGGLGSRYLPLLRSWVAHGYVVAAPVFPFAAGDNRGGDGVDDGTSTQDLVNQPADMAFTITQLLRLNDDATSPLKGVVDPGRVGAAGHSLGAMTTLALAANTCCYDQRVKAAAILSGREMPFGNGTFFTRIRTPLLLVHGDADANVAYRDGRKAYADAPPPRFLLTLLGGDHSAPYDPFESAAAQATAQATLAFFDGYLKGDNDGVAQLRTAGSTPDVARTESET